MSWIKKGNLWVLVVGEDWKEVGSLLEGGWEEPVVTEDLLDWESLLDVDFEHVEEEVLGHDRDELELGLHEVKVPVPNVLLHLLHTAPLERQFPTQQFVQQHSCRPHVALLFHKLFLQDFRRLVLSHFLQVLKTLPIIRTWHHCWSEVLYAQLHILCLCYSFF